jgi:hypothetical protein
VAQGVVEGDRGVSELVRRRYHRQGGITLMRRSDKPGIVRVTLPAGHSVDMTINPAADRLRIYAGNPPGPGFMEIMLPPDPDEPVRVERA